MSEVAAVCMDKATHNNRSNIANVNHIHLDVIGGIAGDMFVACLCDTFIELQPKVLAAVKLVLPSDAGEVKFWTETNAGIGVNRFELALTQNNLDDTAAVHQSATHKKMVLSHQAVTGFQSISLIKTEKVDTSAVMSRHAVMAHTHSNTTYKSLKKRINSSQLTDKVKRKAVMLLTRLAVAEAKIHQLSLDDVHFHELADWDSLMDVVAAAVIITELSAVGWSVSNLPYGGGFIKSAHGLIPVPAPATAEILVGFKFIDDGIKGERITPTGAAILAELIDPRSEQIIPAGRLIKTGYGGGSKRFKGCPNILRAVAFSA